MQPQIFVSTIATLSDTKPTAEYGEFSYLHSEHPQTKPKSEPAVANILRCTLAAKKLGISRSSFYEKLRPNSRYFDATFPKPIQLGLRSVGWFCHELDEWLLAQSAKVKGASK